MPRRWHGVLVMMGREHEKGVVESLLSAARAGQASSTVLVGLPGIGKTSLLDHAEAVAAETGLTAYRITAVESESGISGSGLSLLHPLLGAGDLVDPWTLLRSITDLAAVHPLLLILDDVHWLDEVSLSALAFVTRRITDDSVAVLMAARPEIDDPLRLADVPRLFVDALPVEDAVALLRAVSPGTPPDIAALLAAALGNVPLALVEAPTLLPTAVLDGSVPPPATLPVGLAVSVRYARGIDAMPERTRRALVVASIEDSGDPAVLADALRRADLSTSDLAAAVAAGLLLPGDALTFRHPLVRAAVHSIATDAERREAHVLLASVHADTGGGELELRHAAAAALGTDEALASRLEAALPDVVARRGRRSASALAARAAALSARPPDRWRRLVLAIEHDRLSPATARSAREVIERCSDPELRTRAALILADEHLTQGEQAALLEEAAGWVGTGPVAEDLMDYRVFLARLIDDRDTLESAVVTLEGWRREGPLSWLSSYLLALAYLALGRPRDAALHALAARVDSEQDPPGAGRAEFMWEWVHSVSMLEDERWDSEKLIRRMRIATAILHANRTPDDAALAELLEARRLLHMGSLRNAKATVLTTLSLGPTIGGLKPAFHRCLIEIEARLGGIEEVLRRADELAVLDGSAVPPIPVRVGRATAFLLAGDAAAALDALRVGPIPRSSDPERLSLPARALEVEALVALDRRDEARDCALVLAELVDGLPSPRMQMLAQRCWALVEPAVDGAQWESALEHGRRSEDIWELARTLLLYGERLRRDRRISESRVPLRESADIFRRSGATVWAERAERELAAAGEVSTLARATGVDLTPQELRIALAVAEGLSNNEIASTVFLSVKTVETHLTRIYRKLGVRSRGGVAKALADAGVAT